MQNKDEKKREDSHKLMIYFFVVLNLKALYKFYKPDEVVLLPSKQ